MQILISVTEAATALGIKPVTIRQWANQRKIGRVKLGRRVLIPIVEIERLIEQNLTPAKAAEVKF
jgi:excisionase family DNA binding protein